MISSFFFQSYADSGQSVSLRLEQLTKLLYSIEDKVMYHDFDMSTDDILRLSNVVSIYFFQAKSSVFESVGYEGGQRKSLIPLVTFEVLL